MLAMVYRPCAMVYRPPQPPREDQGRPAVTLSPHSAVDAWRDYALRAAQSIGRLLGAVQFMLGAGAISGASASGFRQNLRSNVLSLKPIRVSEREGESETRLHHCTHRGDFVRRVYVEGARHRVGGYDCRRSQAAGCSQAADFPRRLATRARGARGRMQG
jgi:hypothetical protein